MNAERHDSQRKLKAAEMLNNSKSVITNANNLPTQQPYQTTTLSSGNEVAKSLLEQKYSLSNI